jgi:hypothetical protein
LNERLGRYARIAARSESGAHKRIGFTLRRHLSDDRLTDFLNPVRAMLE